VIQMVLLLITSKWWKTIR